MTTIVRWIFFASGVMNVALATVFFDRVSRPLMSAWWRRFTPPGREPSAFLMHGGVQRLSLLVTGIAALGVWWVLSTPEGSTVFARLVHGGVWHSQ